MSELYYLSATEAITSFRARRLSPVELVRALIARRELVEPHVRAFTYTFDERALAAARAAEARYAAGTARPLEGVPVGIKDVHAIAGALARTVADCALMQNVMSGPSPTDLASLPDRVVLPQAFEEIAGWRIAWSMDLGYLAIDPEVRAATLAALELFRALGCTVEHVELGWTDRIPLGRADRPPARGAPSRRSPRVPRGRRLRARPRALVRRRRQLAAAATAAATPLTVARAARLAVVIWIAVRGRVVYDSFMPRPLLVECVTLVGCAHAVRRSRP